MQHKIIPIEVKSSKNYKTMSLERFKALYSRRIAQSFIIHPKNFVYGENLLKIPSYMFTSAFPD